MADQALWTFENATHYGSGYETTPEVVATRDRLVARRDEVKAQVRQDSPEFINTYIHFENSKAPRRQKEEKRKEKSVEEQLWSATQHNDGSFWNGLPAYLDAVKPPEREKWERFVNDKTPEGGGSSNNASSSSSSGSTSDGSSGASSGGGGGSQPPID